MSKIKTKSDWYDVIMHRDHDDIIYRRRYIAYTAAANHLLRLAHQYRDEGWTVRRMWENGHVHLIEKKDEASLVLRLVGRVEWRRDWLPFLKNRGMVMRPKGNSRGRCRKTWRRWARAGELVKA